MLETLRILVTDDEEGMRLGVARVLERYVATFDDLDAQVRYESSTAATGEEALEQIDQSPPDLLLLDYKLPGASGLDVLRTLQQQDALPLTVMITAYASLHTAIDATKSGAFDFLPKPFTPEELKASIRKASRHLLLQRRVRDVEEERRRARFELISVVAHELKAPLAAIEGYLNLLDEDDQNADTRRRWYRRCRSRLEGMRKLVFDLLDLTRIESGHRTRELVALDLIAVATSAVDAVVPVARQRSIELRLDAPDVLSFTADRSELEVMFSNLLSNAVKYNREGGSVTVTIRDDPEGVRIDVADTGIGIAPADLEKLFREFVRLRTPETRAIEGSGLGLSILKRLATLYGGTVSVDSTPGRGSTFTVILGHQAAAVAAETGP